MILYTPIHFDKNEWFILGAVLLVIILILIFPKRLHFVEVLTIWLLNIYLTHTIDYTVVGPPVRAYFPNDQVKYEIFDFILSYVLYPSTIYLFVNGYASCQFVRKHYIFYILCATIVTTGLEQFANVMGVYTYQRWSIWYSLIAYIPVYGLNMGMYLFARNHACRFSKPNL